ncbi:MAG: hypothetical protein EA352_09640 [Gemmatimonadales bacterium]|nr:MAG: hypothetical protein EA352_09640 [Gemmatimonadales bacterium]
MLVSATLRSAHFLLVALALLLVVPPSTARGQAPGTAAELLEAQNVRAEPNGTIIGRLEEGTRVSVVRRIDGWTEVRLAGSVWMESLITREEGDFDLQVVAGNGENLRSEPSGRILGRLGSGTLLMETGREPGWVRVERVAWIWSQSLGFADDTGEFPVPVRIDPDPDPEPAPPADTATEPDPDPGDPDPGDPAEPDTSATPAPHESGDGADAPPGAMLTLQAGQALLLRPGGIDTLAVLAGASSAEVREREGEWMRVQLEAWVPAPGRGAEGEDAPPPPLLRGVTPTEIATSPDEYLGARVELELQFISVEAAEAIRTDFTEGEPFLLTRSAGAGQRFVYVAIDPDRVDEFRGLAPLDRIRIEGRVRAGRAALTGHPVLDLLDWERVRR